MKHSSTLVLLLLLAFLSSCQYYRQDIILQTEANRNWTKAKADLEQSYRLNRGDWIEITVYTNKGEGFFDPNSDFARQISGTNIMTGVSGTGGGNVGVNSSSSLGAIGAGDNTSQKGRFQITTDGFAVLPMVGKIKLDSLTYRQADSLLASKFAQFYEDPFVITRSALRRVFYLTSINGSGGAASMQGGSKVISIQHDRTHLLEVITLAGGLQAFTKAAKVRIIRGDLKNPQVQVVNLHTIESIMTADLLIMPNDIIYVEAGRRPLVEAFKDFAPFISTILGLSSLTLSTILAFRAFGTKY